MIQVVECDCLWNQVNRQRLQNFAQNENVPGEVGSHIEEVEDLEVALGKEMFKHETDKKRFQQRATAKVNVLMTDKQLCADSVITTDSETVSNLQEQLTCVVHA